MRKQSTRCQQNNVFVCLFLLLLLLLFFILNANKLLALLDYTRQLSIKSTFINRLEDFLLMIDKKNDVARQRLFFVYCLCYSQCPKREHCNESELKLISLSTE